MNAHALCAALVFVGWAGISFAQARHHHDAFGRIAGVGRLRALRLGGALALAAAFAGCVALDGWEFGPVRWTVLLCLGALAWVLALAASPRRARWLVLIVLVCALLIDAV